MYRYGIVYFTGISISSLVGRRVCLIHIFYLQYVILMHVQHTIPYLYIQLPSKHIEDQKLKIIFNS